MPQRHLAYEKAAGGIGLVPFGQASAVPIENTLHGGLTREDRTAGKAAGYAASGPIGREERSREEHEVARLMQINHAAVPRD